MNVPQLSDADVEMDENKMEDTPASPSGIPLGLLDQQDAQTRPASDTCDSQGLQSAVGSETREFSQSTRQQVEQFLEKMDAHQASMKESHVKLVDLRAQTSWEDMLKAAQEAETVYQMASGKPLRRLGRWVSGMSDSALPFLRLIPSDSYGAVLYGGLRLVFEAASQLDERRSKVLKSCLRIPNIILQAEGCVQNFPSDGLLFERAEEVFRAALPVIEGVTRWLKQNPSFKQARAVLLGSRYNKSFNDKLQNLNDALNELQARTTILRDAAIRETGEAITSVKNVVDRTDTHMSAVIEDLKSSAKAQEQTQSMVSNIRDLEEIRRTVRLVWDQTVKASAWMEEKDRAIRRLKFQLEALEKAGATMTRDDMLDLMDVRADDIRAEFRRLHCACQSTEITQYQVALSVYRDPRMQQWMTQDGATALFIETRSLGGLGGRITPLSFVSTEVIDTLRDQEPAVAIYFFCGYHASPSDSVQGPIGMMRSLIAQVLRLYPVQLDFVSRRVGQQLESFHLFTLCNTFVKLVKRLPHTMVLVCVIDSISYFEQKTWGPDCRYIFNEIQELLNEGEVPPVFKLLVTSPVRSKYVADEFPERNRLLV